MKRKLLIGLFVFMFFVPFGCASAEKQQYKAAGGLYVATIDALTMGVEQGWFNDEQIERIEVVAEEGKNCLNDWHAHLKDPDMPTADWFGCVNNAVIKLLEIQKGDIQ